MALAAVTLDDKYAAESGRVYLNGSQAIVRLAMLQRQRDVRAGLNTACFAAGYRGSPVHTIDREMWRAQPFLERNHIHFLPAVNEDLAATACWGSQQIGLFGDSRYDGVFAMWYGKGPGLDRSLDAMRHANLAGTARYGGVLALAGDDHAMRSSDVPATCEPTFADLLMPVLYPANVQEVLDLGLYGWALSRYCGAWVGFKIVFETVDASASVSIDPDRVDIVLPEDFEMPPGGVNIRLPDPWLTQEPRLRRYKIEAAKAFCRANRLNRVTLASPRPRFGIVASGKAWLDVRQAMAELGLDDATAAGLGITVFKVAMPHPLEVESVFEFADGLEEILVVEEKRRIIEVQIKDAAYALPESRRPRIVGRYDEEGGILLSELGDLTPEAVARAIAKRIAYFHTSDRIAARLAFIEAKERQRTARLPLELARLPYFCSGCPHNTSTRVPDGSRAQGGVGCHFMATYMDRNNVTHTHMGGEGATWIGQAPFVDTPHVFQNMGDGTYYHSGLLAIRAAVAAGVNITYKILFNDAVAMTGGQPLDGPLDPAIISRQVHAEGVGRIAVVTDEPGKYPSGTDWAPGVTIAHRRSLDRVQRELRGCQGVSVLIYDQTCAAEKRRRRKRGLYPDPPKRAFVNERVCEGCGDCNDKSNCLSVLPIETEWGRKRMIDQSSCNKDFSCVEGFCPSFVTVHGGRVRKQLGGGAGAEDLPPLPAPALADIPEGGSYGILVTGVGGTGVVTIGALLGIAAHMEGKGCSVVDQLGMAQKGGAVMSHLRIARRPGDIDSVRLDLGAARLLLGCDILVSGSDAALDTVEPGTTRAVVNTQESITGHFTRNPDLRFPSDTLHGRIDAAVGADRVDYIAATRLATRLMGDSIATNLFVLGYAVQCGLIPVSAEAIERAIELNGVAVEMNRQAFAWGRRLAVDPAAVEKLAAPRAPAPGRELSTTFDEAVARRLRELTAYQNAAYAERYAALVRRVAAAEAEKAKGRSGLADAVARYAYKLMAYKDEYEVARLYTDGVFLAQVREQFEDNPRLRLHLAPPMLTRRDPDTGLPIKRTFGPWILGVMRVLARFRFLRGTPFDPFGRTAERRAERRLIEDYEAVLDELIAGLDHDNHALAVEIASLPEDIRGFGYVKDRHLAAVKAREAELLAAFRAPADRVTAAE